MGSFIDERGVEARNLRALLPRRWRAPPWRGRRDVVDVHAKGYEILSRFSIRF